MLEPVLENYMGPPISYNSTTPASKPSRHGASTAKVTPASEIHQSKRVTATSLNPVNIFGKLRDKYIKAMNEISMGGDLASVAGYHGCVAGTDQYPGAVDQHRKSSAAREKEIRALREELAARRRLSSELVEEDSDDEDLGVAHHHHHHRHHHQQYKSVR